MKDEKKEIKIGFVSCILPITIGTLIACVNTVYMTFQTGETFQNMLCLGSSICLLFGLAGLIEVKRFFDGDL